MKFNLKYKQEEAKKVTPRILKFISENWKNVSFPTSHAGIGLWNYLSSTDEKWEEREYNLFFRKGNFFGSDHCIHISFKTSDVEEIETNSNSEKHPSQIIIKLKNNVSIWFGKLNSETVDVYINTEGVN